MSRGLLSGLVDKVREGRLSRREFIRGVGAVIGVSAATSLLDGVGLRGITPSVGAAPVAQAGEVRPEDWERMLFYDCTPFKKDPPWSIANLSQGPTNSWALMLDGHSEYAVKEKYKGTYSVTIT